MPAWRACSKPSMPRSSTSVPPCWPITGRRRENRSRRPAGMRAAEWIGLNDYAEAYAHWQGVRELTRHSAESPEASELHVRSLLRLMMFGYRVAGFQDEAAAVFAE